MAPKGVPHDVLCPEVNCRRSFKDLREGIEHLTTVHHGKCAVCSLTCDQFEEAHFTACTMKVTAVCGLCMETYFVHKELQHYVSHTGVSVSSTRTNFASIAGW